MTDQFQIGDEVIYMPENVITTVDGYEWLIKIDGPPEISLYKLDCGISVDRKYIKKKETQP